MQKATQMFSSDCGRAQIYVENEMPIGVFHDFLLLVKGEMVQRMVQAQKDQEAEAKAALAVPIDPSELPTPCEDKFERVVTPAQTNGDTTCLTD